MGVPTVTIVTDQFVTLARGTQKSQGLTDMCFVTVPHPIGMLPKEQVDAKVDAAFGDIVKAATQWQPVKEKEAAQESPYPAKTFKFTGTYADVNKLFAKRKWSLSLPIIPPTVDRVREMLKGTKHAPSEVLWVVPPRQGMLTVELVAVLGVMAGAQPEHMPLLLATIDAMKAPEAAWRGTSTTTAPTSPLIVISGPIVEKLKLNAGTGTAGGENPVTNALGYFVNLVGDVVGGSVPKGFFPAVEKGLRECIQRGPLAGYPVVGLSAVLYDGSYHPVDSSEMAFKVAGSLAFKKAIESLKPVLLEPIVLLCVSVPDEYMGDVIGDLSSRRGKVLGSDSQVGITEIKAHIPMSEVLRYAPDLRSITGGQGVFTMEFDHYEEAPQPIVDKVIAEHQKVKAEE